MRRRLVARSLHVNPVGWKRITTHTLLVIFSLEHYLVTTTAPRYVTHVAARNGKLVGFVISHSKNQAISARYPNNPQASVCVAVRFWQ